MKYAFAIRDSLTCVAPHVHKRVGPQGLDGILGWTTIAEPAGLTIVASNMMMYKAQTEDSLKGYLK